ncbi:hypothetical protein M405DRAFT_929283 [Rhizopogon salebrosus TDB-379]|nr:hypothetical protein M405DRAFT_929283 [Rhizopogon salebrosus TDB-379]
MVAAIPVTQKLIHDRDTDLYVEFPQSQAHASEVIPTQVLQGTRKKHDYPGTNTAFFVYITQEYHTLRKVVFEMGNLEHDARTYLQKEGVDATKVQFVAFVDTIG